jgi:UDP-N-acetylmuramate dehydrogenase
MRLGGPARYMVDITTKFQVAEALAWAQERQLPVVMIGGGSNIIWGDQGFAGLVLVNKIMGFEVFEEDAESTYVTVGAGEEWDSVVERTVAQGLSGIESLSLIPGTAGATPIQNVGAYGREIKDVLVTVEVYDQQAGSLVTLRPDECQFGYRMSRFKGSDKGRFFITSITIHLTHQNPQPPFYAALERYFQERGVTEFTPAVVRDAVVAIRSLKLPDPKQVANNGSFFFNPVIDQLQATELADTYPTLTYWPLENNQAKISAAWLVEQAGFKGVHDPETGMATWENQPLVLVNEHAHSTADLIAFKQKIVEAVQAKFGITLAQEPELIG